MQAIIVIYTLSIATLNNVFELDCELYTLLLRVFKGREETDLTA